MLRSCLGGELTLQNFLMPSGGGRRVLFARIRPGGSDAVASRHTQACTCLSAAQLLSSRTQLM